MSYNTRTPIRVNLAKDHISKSVTEGEAIVVSDDVWKRLRQQSLATTELATSFQGDVTVSEPVKSLGISLRFERRRFLPTDSPRGENKAALGKLRDDWIFGASLDSDVSQRLRISLNVDA